ncbi:MAG: hypothetical protein F2894_02175 [Actinobacteria bacterium]|uniref:Unannotated protein n=1 Tax=freshwater metagenome TaxID=449393 RepID=A0A6J7PQ54_9ZZZZ|nr:hypothetical protein [Actinomycetota bacterium]MSW04995.1 hypothetical protein [Actinomycetota bacterium]MSX81560.1 hypothetical protein [Actinomycetota bacterium]
MSSGDREASCRLCGPVIGTEHWNDADWERFEEHPYCRRCGGEILIEESGSFNARSCDDGGDSTDPSLGMGMDDDWW